MKRTSFLPLRRLFRQASPRRALPSLATFSNAVQHASPSSSSAGGISLEGSSADETRMEGVSLSQRQKEKLKMAVQEGSSRSTTSRANRVDIYLASIRAEGIEPVLKDLERLKPIRHPQSTSPRYAKAYQDLVDRICLTFSKSQLRDFCVQYGMEQKWTGKSRRKTEYAESIMTLQWGWENLKEVQRRHRDMTEVFSKKFTVSPHELFLLLGKDGSELLQMTIDFNVHIGVEPKPLSIRIEGLRGSLKHLEALIAQRRKNVIQERIKLPLQEPMSATMLQQVSRLANAFIENVGHEGEVIIFANDVRRLETAKKLVVRAAEQIARAPFVPLLAFMPPPAAVKESDLLDLKPVLPPEQQYAMYPFISPRSSPSTFSRSGGNVFRCRRVNEWLGARLGEDVRGVGGLADNKNIIMDKQGNRLTVQQLLQEAFPHVPKTPIVRVSTGHILLTDETTLSQQQRNSLRPPLDGIWPLDKFLLWSGSSPSKRVTFMPSLPAPLLNARPASQSVVHRLTYRCFPRNALANDVEFSHPLPSKILTFEATLSSTVDAAGKESPTIEKSVLEDDDGLLVENNSIEQHSVFPSLEIRGPVARQQHEEIEYLVCLPDRPMDIKLTICKANDEPDMGNEDVQSYFSSFNDYLQDTIGDNPEPPLFIQSSSEIFTLEMSASVRRSTEEVAITSPVSGFIHSDPVHVPPANATENNISAVTENVLDLQTNQTILSCELSCGEPYSMMELEAFLLKCDALTAISYRPIATPNDSFFGPEGDKSRDQLLHLKNIMDDF